MAELTDGLFLHDIVLIVLGSLMFLILLAGLMVKIMRGEEAGKMYLLGFLIPVLMIAYPSIQRMSFSRDLIELDKAAEYVAAHPEDTQARMKLDEQLEEVESRPIRSSDTRATAAKANYVQGNVQEAEEQAEKALEQDPENETARDIKGLVDFDKQVVHLERNPTDTMASRKLEQHVKELDLSKDGWIKKRIEDKIKDVSARKLLPPEVIKDQDLRKNLELPEGK